MKKNVIVWLSEWKQEIYFLIGKLFCFGFDLLIDCLGWRVDFRVVYWFLGCGNVSKKLLLLDLEYDNNNNIYLISTCGEKNHL